MHNWITKKGTCAASEVFGKNGGLACFFTVLLEMIREEQVERR